MPELMQHQREALSFLKDKKNAGLFFEMGLGKTLTILEHLASLTGWMKNGAGIACDDPQKYQWPIPALIVCPKSVVSVWEDEVEKFGYPFKVIKLTGTFNERLAKLNQDGDIYVVNYEGMRILRSQLEQKKFKSVILDESHRIKERSSQQTAAALSIAASASYRYILTGTPVTKSPEDLWTQMQFVSPNSLGNFWAFRNRYIDFKTINVRMPGGIKEIRKAFRFKNLAELEGRLSEHCLRRTKAECLDLPEKIYKTIHCELSKEQAKAYHEIKHSLETSIENQTITVSTAAAALNKMRQVCQGFVYNEVKDVTAFKKNAKMDTLIDLIDDIPADDKIILFTWFKADIEILKQLQVDRRVLFYHGNADERGRIVREFQEASDSPIFLAQIETAKEGITLNTANHVIYFGNSWSYGTRIQSEDRAHRIGQKRNVVYYDVVAANTVDEYVQKVLKMKGDLADKVTGDSIRLAKLACGMGCTEEDFND